MDVPENDDLAEIDTTPEQFARYMEHSEPAQVVDTPAHKPISIRGESTTNLIVIENVSVSEPAPTYVGTRVTA